MTITEQVAPDATADDIDRPLPVDAWDRMWTLRAECRGLDYDAFTPGPYTTPRNDDAVRMAQRVCTNCEVRSNCRDDALQQANPAGVWGGTFIPQSNRGGQRTAALNRLRGEQDAAA